MGGEAVNFHGNPIVLPDRVITGSDAVDSGNLFAIDRATGNAIWHIGAERGFPSDLVASDSTFFAISMDDTLYCVALEDGAILWRFGPGPPLTAEHWPFSPVIDGNTLYYGSRDGTLYAINTATGAVVWKRVFGSAVSTTLIADAQTVTAGTADGHLYRVAKSGGTVVDSIDLGSQPKWVPVQAGHTIGVLTSLAQEVTAVDDSLTSILWSWPTQSEWSSYRPYNWNGLIIAGDGDGYVWAFEPETGDVVWTIQLTGTIRGIGGAGDILLVGTLQGTVYAIRITPGDD